jgi:hypothetical protein
VRMVAELLTGLPRTEHLAGGDGDGPHGSIIDPHRRRAQPSGGSGCSRGSVVGGRVPWTRRPGSNSASNGRSGPDHPRGPSLASARPRPRGSRRDARSAGSRSAQDLRPSATAGVGLIGELTAWRLPEHGPTDLGARPGPVAVHRRKDWLPVYMGPGPLL